MRPIRKQRYEGGAKNRGRCQTGGKGEARCLSPSYKRREKEREVRYIKGNEKNSNQNGKVLFNSFVIKDTLYTLP